MTHAWIAWTLMVGIAIVPIWQCNRAWNEITDWPCENVKVAETPSPDGKVRLVEYIRRCGVMSTDTREFSVFGAKQRLADANGNAFRLLAETPEPDGAPEDDPSPAFGKWFGNDHLEIAYQKRIEVLAPPSPVTLHIDGTPRTVQLSARPVERLRRGLGKPTSRPVGLKIEAH